MRSDYGPVSAAAEDERPAAGPLLQAELSLSRAVWRIGPAWSVLAGALAGGWAPSEADAILRLGAAILLGDLTWGSLRQLLPRAGIDPAPSAAFVPVLPYAAPDAPLARFLNGLAAGAGLAAHVAWQPLAVLLALTVALSLLLGLTAAALSVGVLLLLMLAWLTVVGRGQQPAFLLALLDVMLPGLLGMSLTGDALFNGLGWAGPIALLGAFMLLQWGVLRAWVRAGSTVGVWLGQLAVIGVLVALKQAWPCALVIALFAPPSWWLLQADRAGIARALPWWWAAFGVAFVVLV